MNTLFSLFFLFPLLPIFSLLFILRRRERNRRNLPPGSLGLPVLGQSMSLLWAMRANTAEKWLQKRVQKYGPISKLSLFGNKSVFIHGQAANKFVFTGDGSVITNQQTMSVRRILGDRCLLELSGEDHRRVRGALASFLRPECLKKYVRKMAGEIRIHLEKYWEGKQQVTVLPLMKTLTFNIICSLIFGIERGARRDEFMKFFQEIIKGVWSVPINVPFTRYNRSIKSSENVRKMLKKLVHEKRQKMEMTAMGAGEEEEDLITCLISMYGDDEREIVTENEIIDNIMLIMVAGHDTSSVLITFMVRLLASNPTVYAAVLEEQEEIAKSKSMGELLTWEDLGKMKYTWRAAMETLRMFPPIFAGFRRTLKDIEYGGYLIPKGWHIFWATSMTHMDGSIFEEPLKFDPTRFENQASVPPYCFIPFGAGPRICPGYEFTRIETLITIHYLVTSFEWKLCCKTDFFSRDPMPVPVQGLPIQIIPKKQV